MRDPIHIPDDERSDVLWSIANTSEAFPGTITPLTWSFIDHGMELGTRQAFYDLGALTKSEVEVPSRYDERITSIFHGKVSANLDYMRTVMDRVPGMSGDKLETAITGELRPGVKSQRTYRRYPAVAVKLPRALRVVPKQARQVRHDTHLWWRSTTQQLDALDAAALRSTFADARQRFALILRPNSTAGLVGGNVFGLGYQLCGAARRMDLAAAVVSGFGKVEETDVAEDLWRTATGRLNLDDFLAAHGYHGPHEGELRSFSWREDPKPVERLLDQYAQLSPKDRPSTRVAAQHERHQVAMAELRQALPASKRGLVWLYERLGADWIPLREVTKAAYLQTMDVARGCARRIGEFDAVQGNLPDPEAVFFLTGDEIVSGRPAGADEIGFRRERWAAHADVQLPERWIGRPEAAEPAAAPLADQSTELTAFGASPGVLEARARVVLDPTDADIEPGEILVCTVTDPSWVSLIVIAGGIVADIGGPMSHAAIISRELGVPCVIATKIGTQVLRTGDLVRIDGTAGTVRVLERAPS